MPDVESVVLANPWEDHETGDTVKVSPDVARNLRDGGIAVPEPPKPTPAKTSHKAPAKAAASKPVAKAEPAKAEPASGDSA